MSLGGKFLDAKLRAPMAGYVPVSPGDIKDYKGALEYGLAQHAGIRELAQAYPLGNWEAPAGYYYQAVEVAANRTSPLASVIAMLSTGDTFARAEVKRLGAGKLPAPPLFVPPPAQPTIAATPPAVAPVAWPAVAAPAPSSSSPSALTLGGLALLAAIIAKKLLGKGKKK